MLNVLLNIILFTIKFIGGKISHSVAITSDAFNNLTDAISTLFAFLGLKVSAFGEGEQHPNGHGRFEWVITLISSISIILVGWELLGSSIDSIKNPASPVFSLFTLIVLIVSIGVKFFMYTFNSSKSKKQNSPSLKAIAIDSLSDAISTLVVLLSLILYTVFKINIDGWCGILVSVFIMYNGLSSCMETVQRIMGQSAPAEKIEEVKKIILSNKNFLDVWNIQIEDFGNNLYKVSAIVFGKPEVDGDTLLKECANIEFLIHEKFGYKTKLSIKKTLPVEDTVKNAVNDFIKKLSVTLVVRDMKVVDAGDKKLFLLSLGISHESFSKLKQVETELANAKFIDGYSLVPEVKLIRPERRRRLKD